ncbi:hypothetical protein LOS25_17790 [Enterococcus faecium]|nr:hypothetical protein [Enterococcus faecium]
MENLVSTIKRNRRSDRQILSNSIRVSKKITNKEAKVEDVLTVRELQSLIEYRNKQITNPEYLKKEDGLLKQLEQVNKIRKMQKVAPLSLDNFKKNLFERDRKKD